MKGLYPALVQHGNWPCERLALRRHFMSITRVNGHRWRSFCKGCRTARLYRTDCQCLRTEVSRIIYHNYKYIKTLRMSIKLYHHGDRGSKHMQLYQIIYLPFLCPNLSFTCWLDYIKPMAVCAINYLCRKQTHKVFIVFISIIIIKNTYELNAQNCTKAWTNSTKNNCTVIVRIRFV